LTILALKLLLAPGFIVATSIVSRRFGVGVGGVVGGLPAIAGPILLVVALGHGRAFASDAATGTLLGIVALIAFVLAYVAVSRRFTWPWALLLGWMSFLGAILVLRPVHVGPAAALAFACAACGATLVLLSRPQQRATSSRRYPRWDLPLRGACAVIPVVSVTAAARLLGPHLTGLLAAFPIITPVLAAFTHAQQGRAEAVRLLHGMTVGFFAYALFCFAVSVTVEGLGVAASFALATALALTAQAAAITLTRRREQPLAAEAAA
jgi:Ca2+/Na+ antiporter